MIGECETSAGFIAVDLLRRVVYANFCEH